MSVHNEILINLFHPIVMTMFLALSSLGAILLSVNHTGPLPRILAFYFLYNRCLFLPALKL